MSIKEFRIFHWDTFDNETIQIGEASTLDEAKLFVRSRYGDRVRSDGADQVDIVDKQGNIVDKYRVI